MAKGQGNRRKLDEKRQRFEEAGQFPVKKVALIGVFVFVALFAGAWGYQSWQASQAVGGAVVAPETDYAAQNIDSTPLEVQTTPDGLTFSLQDVTQGKIVDFDYARTNPMPAEYAAIAGGDVLPLISYIAPSGRLVVATSFCEPCRSKDFHIEGSALVCDVCFTKWDLDTLAGLGGGCAAYPPEEVTAEVQGDQVLVPTADLEAWQPRAF